MENLGVWQIPVAPIVFQTGIQIDSRVPRSFDFSEIQLNALL